MILEIILSAALLASIAAIFILLKKISSSADNDNSEALARRYEETSSRLLEETRRQYEKQITTLELRLERQAAEVKRTSAIEFENLANEALERQAERLSAGNRMEISSILNPLKENLGDFRRAVNDSYVKENSSREALKAQIDDLMRANAEIGEEARRLSFALRGDARMQGRWGEQVLERLLDSAGFIRDIHYKVQAGRSDGTTLRDDEGHGLRPDMIFLLPGGSKIVIDSKTSLSAYLKYCEAKSDVDEKNALKAHAESVKRHIDELSRAQYHKYIEGALEHTLMFMPNDGAYLAVIRADIDLTEYAMKRNVVIVAPTHLLSIIQLVNQLWRIDKQNRNAEQIAALGGKLYDKFVTFLSDFDAVQRNIESAAKSYEKCRRHLCEGGTSLTARAQKLRDLGAKTSKSISSAHLSLSRQETNGNDDEIYE